MHYMFHSCCHKFICPLQSTCFIFNSQPHAEFEDALPGKQVTSMIAKTITTLSQVAFHVHLLFALCFLSDLSLASAVFPLSSLLYSLVSEPRPIFWKMLLVYAEAMLVVQYGYQVVLRAGCLEVGSEGHNLLQRLGIHSSVVCAAFLFLYFMTFWVCYIVFCLCFHAK